MTGTDESFDAEKLLLEINSGKPLLPDDERLIGELLADPDSRILGRHLSQDDIYSIVLIVGKAKLTKFRHLIAAFLDRDDPLTVSLVLEVLCLDWKETAEFLERIISFALGVPWDQEGDVRQTAIKITGEHLRTAIPSAAAKKLPLAPANQHVLSLLINLFEEDEDEWIKFAAYRAMLRGSGVEAELIPSDGVLPNLSAGSPDIDAGLIVRLKKLAGYSSDSFSESSGSPGKGPASTR